MNVPMPVEVLKELSEIETCVDVHDGNGPGRIVCHSCSAAAPMKWRSGARLDKPTDIVHSPNCPVLWALRVLRYWPENQGESDNSEDVQGPSYRNYYRHADCDEEPGIEWNSVWSCTCNDRCPACDHEIEPYNSEDVQDEQVQQTVA